MPQARDLPDDIWIEMIQSHLSDPSNAQLRDTLRQFSLTSQRFRSFAIPVLYHSLSFYIDGGPQEPPNLIPLVVRNSVRVNNLMRFPHLLRNVQRLSLRHWDGNLSYAGLRGITDDEKKVLAVIYDSITRLVPLMSGLRELRLFDCAMTPFLYAAISACPLNLLHMRVGHTPIPIPISTDLPSKLQIHNLHYSYSAFSRKTDDITDPYVARIFEHSISSVKRLSLDASVLPIFASYISNKALSLEFLSVSFPPERTPAPVWRSSAASSFQAILLTSPNIRSLIIEGQPALDQYVLPSLVEASAAPNVLPILTQGKTLERIHVTDWFNVRDQPLTQLIRCSPTHLRHFSVTCLMAQTVPQLLDFIQSLSLFTNLESLDILYWINLNLGEIVDDQLSSITITNLLHDLSYLRTCHIWNMIDADDQFHRISTLVVDPQSLVHSSLEVLGIDFYTKNIWYREGEAGWVQRGWAKKLAQAQNVNERNPLSWI